MGEKVQLNFLVDAIKYSDGKKISPRNVLSIMALSSEPFVIMPDGTVYGPANTSRAICSPLDLFACFFGTDNTLKFNDPIAAKFAQEHDGIYLPSKKEKEEPPFPGVSLSAFHLSKFIECVRRLSKKLPDGKLKEMASQPDFLKDLESELKYLSGVEPLIHQRSSTNIFDYTHAYGVKGKIIDPEQENSPEKSFGHEKNKYSIDLRLLLEFFGEDHFNVSSRYISADIAVNPLIRGASLNEYGLSSLKELIEGNKDLTNRNNIRTDIDGKRVNEEYKFVTLRMSSPDPISQTIRTSRGRPENEITPLTTEELLAKFVPLANKISAGFVKIDEQVQSKIQLDYKNMLGL